MKQSIKRILFSKTVIITLVVVSLLFVAYLFLYLSQSVYPNIPMDIISNLQLNINGLQAELANLDPNAVDYGTRHQEIVDLLNYYNYLKSLNLDASITTHIDLLTHATNMFGITNREILQTGCEYLILFSPFVYFVISGLMVFFSHIFITSDYKIGYNNLFISNYGVKAFYKRKFNILLIILCSLLILFITSYLAVFSILKDDFSILVFRLSATRYFVADMGSFMMSLILSTILNAILVFIFSFCLAIKSNGKGLNTFLSILFLIACGSIDGLFTSYFFVDSTVYWIIKIALILITLCVVLHTFIFMKKRNYLTAK